MSQPDIDTIKQAQELIRSKELSKAQRLLVEYIKKNPHSEQAWLVLSSAVDDPRKQIECLQRVLRINPANADAQSRLMQVMAAQAAPPVPVSTRQPITANQTPSGELAPPMASSTASAIPSEQPASSSAPPAVEPLPAEVPQPITSAEPVVDTELSSLRSKAKFVKLRKPRKRWPRIVILLLLILLAGVVGGYLLWNNFNQAANPASEKTPGEAVVVVPTDTPAPTDTPTVTPTPSITPTRYPPTWTPTPLPTAPPTRTPTPLPTFNPAVQTGLLRLRDQVAAARGLQVATDIPTALLPPEIVETTLKSILDIQRRQPELVNQARDLAAVGLVRPGFDLSRYAVNRFADNAGGFYVPWQTVVDVAGSDFGGVAGVVYAHQVAHALLDQRFRFADWGLQPSCTLGEDQCQALQTLIEGDAALTTDSWLKQHATEVTSDTLAEYEALPPAIDDPSAPPFIERDVAFRGEYGRKFVDALYQSGGWAAVNTAYENLPASTEQVLHPEKYLKGEKPIEVADVPLGEVFGAGWQLIANEALGEWRTYMLLSANVDEAARLSNDTAQKAADGWGGDRYRMYYDPGTDQSALVVEWRWDTPQDATEFQQAMSAYLDLRFRGAKSQASDQSCWSANRQTTCLYSTENGTLWVLAPELQLVDQVRQAYPDYK
jgi:hypothetical protein